eukprot:TRINITY_DN7314_c0_g1_i4.p1 TRINITY_DN7314_c0_g1~~TRINITY_DN7314_c0_g1_i4.p1  ORF type:complete len:469 (+),score=62.09 TRINITY_DN7314_c0_g1_i4:37-1407(+)
MEQTLLDVTGARQVLSKPRKILVVVSAIVACFSTAGLAFGFSALLPQLIASGAFHDECPVGSTGVCDRQMSKLTDMFTLAVSLLNVASMPGGAILDRFGPKLTATCFLFLVGMGCITFSLGGPGYSHAYYVGFLLLAFGFSALLPQLIASGAFHDECPVGSTGVCDRQMSKLTDMFTLAVSLLNVASMPGGAILDRFGPKLTATCFLFLVGMGCITFSLGGPGYSHAYYVGFLLLAVSGPCNFNCTLSFGNLFPERAGLITAALVGCFDASSAIFAILAAAMRDGGLSLGEVFQAYAMLPLLLAVVAAAFWPMAAVTCERAPADSERERDPESDAPARKNGILSLPFLLFTYTVATNMVCINFFIATAYSQLSAGGGSSGNNDAEKMNAVFGAILPLGGVVFIPVIGLVIDTLGPSSGYFVLSCAYFIFSQLMAVHSLLEAYFSPEYVRGVAGQSA